MRVYFKNLDGIRFIAALLVVLHHAQFFKIKYHVGALPFLDTALNTGRTGVNLFFVLSGFLISYLLMREHEQTGTISLRNFYMRRILRIWPLYLAYGIGLTVLAPLIFKAVGIPAESDLHTILINLVFVLLFAINFQLAFFPYNKDILEITWSVCVEEQFYLLWPVLMLSFRKHLKTLFGVMLAIGFLSKLAGILVPLYFPVGQQHMLDMTYLM
ncbi:MAG TPA: acyltransferase, partial [Chitinophaga sp.]